jgi:hypothetical protein
VLFFLAQLSGIMYARVFFKSEENVLILKTENIVGQLGLKNWASFKLIKIQIARGG